MNLMLFLKKKINKNNVKKIIIAEEIKGVFKINEFKWLNECAIREQKNENFAVYNINSKC